MRTLAGKLVLLAAAFAFGLLLLLAFSPFSLKGEPAQGGPAQAGAYVDDEILVKFLPGTPARAALEAHRQARGWVVGEVPALHVKIVKVGPGRAAAQLPVYQRNP